MTRAWRDSDEDERLIPGARALVAKASSFIDRLETDRATLMAKIGAMEERINKREAEIAGSMFWRLVTRKGWRG